MVESTCFQHTSSHPDKNNNSVIRIISKEEEREDPRRDSSIYLRVQWCFHIPTRTTVSPHAVQQLQVILHTELILLQEFSKKYYNYKAHPVSSRADQYKASSSNCSPCLQAFYTAESSHKALQHKQASNNSTR